MTKLRTNKGFELKIKQMFQLGLVNMYGSSAGAAHLRKAMSLIGILSKEIDGFSTSSESVAKQIQESSIPFWIFSGSPHQVMHLNSPQVPMSLLDSPQRFLMICYSMESCLVQLGYPLVERYTNKKEIFHLKVRGNLETHWRNHRWYTPKSSFALRTDPGPKLLASYRREAMMVEYNNMLMVQFHPERTDDGIDFMRQWLLMG
jgi:GMP synthase-like glutamine amidotransferase